MLSTFPTAWAVVTIEILLVLLYIALCGCAKYTCMYQRVSGWRKQIIRLYHPRKLDLEHGPDSLSIVSITSNANSILNAGGTATSTDVPAADNLAHRKAQESVTLDRLNYITNLASTRMEERRFVEAEALSMRALRLGSKAFGEEHPVMLMNMTNLAIIRMQMGQLQAAETLGTRAVKLSSKVLGVEHQITLCGRALLASVHHDQARSLPTQGHQAPCQKMQSSYFPKRLVEHSKQA